LPHTKKRSTGIAGLDLALEGGFPSGARIIVFGSPLSGLEMLARQFWQSENETGTYLMLDADAGEGMTGAQGLDPDGMADALQGDRIVVDSLSTLIRVWGTEAAYAFFTKGTDESIRRGANTMFLLYAGLHSPLEEARMMRAADIFIILRQEIHGSEFERTLAIEKLKGMNVPQRVIPYHITARGLELSTTSRVV
jgi:KaiC/GvpD/RAD55 family RecA-like ATPase